jgi:hypothetical protein
LIDFQPPSDDLFYDLFHCVHNLGSTAVVQRQDRCQALSV